MNLNLDAFNKYLSEAEAGETVPTGDVNPYLLECVLKPMLYGKKLCYGDIDYSKFETDELRALSGHCDERWSAMGRIQALVSGLSGSRAAACSTRAYC